MYAKDEDRPRNVFPILPSTSGEPQPTPRTAREIAEIYEVSDRTIQQWYRVVIKAYPWLKESDLKTGRSAQTKYTILFQEWISDFRESGMGAEEWISAIHSSNADKLPKEKTTSERSLKQFHLTQAVEVEVVEDEFQEIQTTSETYTAQPILQVNLQHLTVTLPEVDTSGLDAQTVQYTSHTAQAVNVLEQFIAADFKAKLTGVLAQNTNLAAALQHSAVVGAVQDLGVGKPEEGGSFRPS